MSKIAIVFYSMYGHIEKLARKIQEGAESEGATVSLFRVPETLPVNVLEMMHAPEKSNDIPVITDAGILRNFDSVIFGTPTRFGTMSAQMKSFMDSTGKLWMMGGLKGKMVGTFFSSGAQGGGQETTALTMLPFFVHHGMIYVPLGPVTRTKELNGGSSWGSGTITHPDSSRTISDEEFEVAKTQGSSFAKYSNKFNS